VRIVGVGLLLVSVSAGVFAQNRPTYLPEKVGVWRPFRTGCSGSGQGLSAEQSRVYTEKLRRISEAIHQSQVFNPPLGIDGVPTGCANATIEFLDDYPTARTGPVPGYVMVGTFSYALSGATGKVAIADEGPHFFVDVNSMVRLYSNTLTLAQDERGRIFVDPQVARSISGLPLYKTGSIVITRIPRPIFQPVSAERYINARIGKARKELADYQKRHQETVSEKRQKSVQDSYQRLRARNPAQAESFLKAAQEGDLKAAETFTRLEQSKEAEIANYQGELAALSQSQRSAQAYVVQNYREPVKSRLLAYAGEAGMEPLVCFNPAFFDRTRPRTDVQALVVGRLYDSGLRERSYDPQYQRVIDFRQTFDFQTLVPLLDIQ
jgi:hypothetical protein